MEIVMKDKRALRINCPPIALVLCSTEPPAPGCVHATFPVEEGTVSYSHQCTHYTSPFYWFHFF